MARNMYGATSADFTLTAGGRVVPGATLTVWSARTGGTQVTDLLDADSVACTTVTSGADGSVVFYGPNNEKSTLWLDSGQGSRIAVRPVDITGETGATPALTIGTVTTGTAAATLTGTDEDPVLSLVLPSAGVDGVNTAAIQAKAVTAAKIADDTITAAQIAANAVGASELADNAVDAAAIQDGSVTPAKLATTGRFVFPTGAANGYGFASGAVHLSGTGAPEGVITAAPGSTWLQTDSTTDVKGWIRWVKATGTGNTGWQAGPEADTGWRDVATDASGLTGSSITAQIRRTGATVAYRLSFAQSGAASGVTVVSAAGFRGTAPTTYVPIYGNNTGAVVGAAEVGSATVKVYTTASGNGGTVSADVMYSTSDAWPSSLPGSAA